MSTHYLRDEAATEAFGQALGRLTTDGAIIYLDGELGAGKTTLCRGVLRAFGHGGAVKSPTYTLVEPYRLRGRDIYHFDLYRLGDPEELEYLGIRDYLGPRTLCLIEWPERGTGFLPAADIKVTIDSEGTGRRLYLEAVTTHGSRMISELDRTLRQC